MAEIILAKTAGFCFGVTRAIEVVEKTLEKHRGEKIYTCGPIIHNDRVVNELAQRGAVPLTDQEVDKLPPASTLVLRSHGVARSKEERLREKGINIVDATCPFVKKIHNIVNKAAEEGKTVIIVGDPDHPEVRGIRGWSGPDTFILPDEEAVSSLPEIKSAIIIAQTTFNQEIFQKMVEKIRLKCYDTSVMNTICNATRERQKEASEIASVVDVMIVIGGRSSSNSQKLYRICKNVCPRTYFAESAADLEGVNLPDIQRVGITAGASTPGNIIQEVLIYVRTKF